MKEGNLEGRTIVWVTMMALIVLMVLKSLTSCLGMAKDKLKKVRQGMDRIALTIRNV